MRRVYTGEPGFTAWFTSVVDDRREAPQAVAAPTREILEAVREGGDEAVCRYTNRFDRPAPPVRPETLRIPSAEIDAAANAVEPEVLDALGVAADRIRAFHRLQMPHNLQHDAGGITLGMRWTPLDAVGLYVPGGRAAYPSSVLMNAIPARVAGVDRIAMCVPCPGGVLQPQVMAAARLAGVDEIFRIGGAQAIGALAYGTPTIQSVDRIVGPGNAYVAEAKRQVYGRVGIDSVAGPSEVLIVADAANDPEHVAIDLLAQCEHDEQAQAILITDDKEFATAVQSQVELLLPLLPRQAIARASWDEHGAIIVVPNFAEAWPLVNRLAPEHLQLMLEDDAEAFEAIRHAGAIFRGRHTPEAIGDYVAGPNHVLPTGRTARFASGLSVYDFLKRTTWVAAEEPGLIKVGPAAAILAEAEGFRAHARSVRSRLPCPAAGWDGNT